MTITIRFFFALSPQKEAFYFIGDRPKPLNSYTFYFKPGDNLSLEVTPDSYKLTGVNTPENVAITKWYEFLLPLEREAIYSGGSSTSFEQFSTLLSQKIEQSKNFKNDETPNKIFNAAFTQKRKLDMCFYAIQYLFTSSALSNRNIVYNDFYRNISISEMTNSDAILYYPFGLSMVEYAAFFNRYLENKELPISELSLLARNQESTDKLLNEVKNDLIKGEIVVGRLPKVDTYDAFLKFSERYGKYTTLPEHDAKMKAAAFTLRSNTKSGIEAYEFKARDIDGKEVSFSQFHGKVVYIDFWATWCGPCLAEIPDLKKLTVEYANKEIVFLSLSVDKMGDLEKWRKMVKTLDLKGVQLIGAEDTPEIKKAYNITSIPRFILIDKKGILVDNNAPRPSTEEIRGLLDSVIDR